MVCGGFFAEAVKVGLYLSQQLGIVRPVASCIFSTRRNSAKREGLRKDGLVTTNGLASACEHAPEGITLLDIALSLGDQVRDFIAVGLHPDSEFLQLLVFLLANIVLLASLCTFHLVTEFPKHAS